SKAQSIPLTYEEARILAFREADAYFRANAEDAAILGQLYWGKVISMGYGPVRIGGLQISVRHGQDVLCRNKECELFGRRTCFEPVAAIPPIPVNGSAEFW